MRIYFEIRDDFYVSADDDGRVYPDIESARKEAIAAATSIARDVFTGDGSEVTLIARDDVSRLFEISIVLKQRDLT
jgi:uncharacterized protein DUF6894